MGPPLRPRAGEPGLPGSGHARDPALRTVRLWREHRVPTPPRTLRAPRQPLAPCGRWNHGRRRRWATMAEGRAPMIGMDVGARTLGASSLPGWSARRGPRCSSGSWGRRVHQWPRQVVRVDSAAVEATGDGGRIDMAERVGRRVVRMRDPEASTASPLGVLPHGRGRLPVGDDVAERHVVRRDSGWGDARRGRVVVRLPCLRRARQPGFGERRMEFQSDETGQEPVAGHS